MGCREFFDANVENAKLCKDLQQLPIETQVAWESESASEYSPGPVLDDERLIRYWLNPTHYDPSTGLLAPTALNDMAGFGLSVNREKYMALEGVLQQAQDRVENFNSNFPDKPVRSLVGFSTFSTHEIRAVMTANPQTVRRATAVYDTAMRDDISHADICQIASDAQGARSARSQLRELANCRLNKV